MASRYNDDMSDPDQVPSMAEANFGIDLRKEREMRGISLKEIADATKVSKRFLEAIEKNDFRTLPAPVFTRGFVREYARYLGLNSEEMVTRYDEHLRTVVPVESETLPEVKASVASKAFPVLAVFVVIGLIGAAIWGAVQWWRTRASSDAATAAAVTAPGTAATPPPATAASATATAPQDAGDGLRLELRFIEDAWIAVEVDGKSALNDEVKAGATHTLRAQDAILFKTIGNAGGVEMTLNGTRLPLLGRSGDVRKNVRFDGESLANLRSQQAQQP